MSLISPGLLRPWTQPLRVTHWTLFDPAANSSRQIDRDSSGYLAGGCYTRNITAGSRLLSVTESVVLPP